MNIEKSLLKLVRARLNLYELKDVKFEFINSS